VSRTATVPQQPNNPLHGVTLEQIVSELVDVYGFPRLGELIAINCFRDNPSVRSSLTFLRRTPWARAKVEELYLATKAGGRVR
jgi:uncharacterized protein (DUF2132 family)